MNTMFQIYMPLAMLKDNFTHYDLHTDNVLMYYPIKDKFIQYHYHIDDNTTVQFKSKYIVKIIDYGRSYSSQIQSDKIYKQLCDICVECGENDGFGWLETPKKPITNYYINSTKRNMSHDLQLLASFIRLISSNKNVMTNLNKNAPYISELLLRVRYNNEPSMGVIENTKIPAPDENGLPQNIRNVVDVYKYIKYYVISNQSVTDAYYSSSSFGKMGDLHIYTDGRIMNFIPSK